MSANQISINNLSKVYDNGFDALKKVNLEIKKGEIIALLGPNIAGNTYVMKNSQFGLNSVIHQDQVVGSYSMIGMGTIVGKKANLKPGYIYVGNPVKGIILNKIGLSRNKISKKKLISETKRFENLKKNV